MKRLYILWGIGLMVVGAMIGSWYGTENLDLPAGRATGVGMWAGLGLGLLIARSLSKTPPSDKN